MLTIAEELYLVALNEKKGKLYFNSSISLSPALAGALLFDLAIAERIVVENKKVHFLEGDSLSSKILSDCLMDIKASKRNRSVNYWVNRFRSRKYDLIERVVDELVGYRFLEKEEKFYAKYILVRKNWILDESCKSNVIQKLNNAYINQLFDDPKTASLFITIVASSLEKLVFEKDQIAGVRETAHWLQMDDQIAEAVRDIVDELTVFLCVTQNASSAT